MRSEDLARVQVGVEGAGTKGTVAPANRFLSAIEDMSPGLNLEIASEGRPKGSKYAAAVVPGREWVEHDFEGMLDYQQIVYLLLGALKRIATPAPGVNGESVWRFQVHRWTPEDPATFTVESGDGTTNERFAYGLLPDLSFELGRDECRVSGRMMGQKFTTGLGALTATPTEPLLVPVLPSQVSVFVDNVAAGLGTTRLLGGHTSRFGLSDHWMPVWTQNAMNGRDFTAHIERRPGVDIGLSVEKDAVANGLLSDARNGAKKFVRIEAEGGVIGGPENYRLALEGAFLVSEYGDPEDDDGVSVQPFTLIPTFDTTLGYAFAVEVVNTLAAL